MSKKSIWNKLLADIGNELGVAALMGNLQAESNLQCNNLENGYESSSGFTDTTYTEAVDSGSYSESSFVNDSYGYGLAQWTYHSRKQGLYNLFKSGGYSSISSESLQVTYLLYELKNSYPSVYSVLKNASSIREASDKVLHDFENPADQSTQVEEYRASLGQAIYNELKGTSGETSNFIPRTSQDGIEGSYYWYEGNPFYQSGYGLPNCTCYAYGRFWEISDILDDSSKNYSNKPTGLSLHDAGKWYEESTYDKGSEAKLGAVAVWSDNDGGAGHVAIVEAIAANGDITISQSAYGGSYFYVNTKSKAEGYNYSGKTFLGFIYNPFVTSGGTDTPDIPDVPIVIGKYIPSKKKKGFKFNIYV